MKSNKTFILLKPKCKKKNGQNKLGTMTTHTKLYEFYEKAVLLASGS